MFRTPLVQELAIALAIKLVLLVILWFSFFGAPAPVQVGSIFASSTSSPNPPDQQR